MVPRIWHNWDDVFMQPLIAPIVQTMIAVHNFAGTESYDENDKLRENRRAAEKNLLQVSKDFMIQITGVQRPFVTA
jgi:hypothetical protein